MASNAQGYSRVRRLPPLLLAALTCLAGRTNAAREETKPEFRRLIENSFLEELGQSLFLPIGAARNALARTVRPAVTLAALEAEARGGCDGVKSGGFGFHTAEENQPWWQVDLGTVAPLGKVVVYNRVAGCCWERAYKLMVLTSQDERKWTTQYRNAGKPFGGIEKNNPLVVDLKGVEARYLRIQLEDRNWLHLDEIEAYGTQQSTANLALGKPAKQSSLSEWSRTVQAPSQAVGCVLPLPVVDEAPKVDGDLSEPCWQNATRVPLPCFSPMLSKGLLADSELSCLMTGRQLCFGIRHPRPGFAGHVADLVVDGQSPQALALNLGGDGKGTAAWPGTPSPLIAAISKQTEGATVLEAVIDLDKLAAKPVTEASEVQVVLSLDSVTLAAPVPNVVRLKPDRIAWQITPSLESQGFRWKLTVRGERDDSLEARYAFAKELDQQTEIAEAAVRSVGPRVWEIAAPLSEGACVVVLSASTRGTPSSPGTSEGQADSYSALLYAFLEPVTPLLDRTRKLLSDLGTMSPPPENLSALTKRLADLEARATSARERLRKAGDLEGWRSLYGTARWFKREVALSNPLLDFDRLLLGKRYAFHSSHIYTDHFDGSSRMGGNLCVLSPVRTDGCVTEIVPELNGGLFGRFDLAFDAKQIVFAYKKPDSGYHLYEVGIDGSGLRQLTQDPEDVGEMIRQFHHGYDDMDPCYLPDGHVMFTSTRCKRTVLCHNAFTTAALHLMDADGGNVRCISSNTVNEFTPTVMQDGRVLYTRWEYVDKGAGNVQSLWAMRPDGSDSAHVYKNNVDPPATLIDGRQIPGSHRLITIAAPHMPLSVGPVVLVDNYITQLTASAMTNITPQVGYPPHYGYPNPEQGYYKDPYPLAGKYFLVAYNPEREWSAPAGYGIYLLDVFGNRELIYRDPAISCFQPIPLRPRAEPPVLPSAVATSVAHEHSPETEPQATLVLLDVYQGMTGIERGRVKYLRVMEDVPKPWDAAYCAPAQGDSLGLEHPVVSLRGHFALKEIHGVVPVQEDGSAYFKVPARKNLYFQALDRNYMELQRMRTFVNLMPGEVRSCIGCHEPRRHAPPAARPVALRQPPRQLDPQPGDAGPRRVHFPTDVQPVLDTYCVKCHTGASPKGALDLSGEMTTLFNCAYENLINKKLVEPLDAHNVAAYIPAVPPLTYGSHKSKLVQVLLSGHYEVKMVQADFVKIVTWVDANAPYYGTYEGKKNLKWKGNPDFRPEPRLVATKTPSSGTSAIGR